MVGASMLMSRSSRAAGISTMTGFWSVQNGLKMFFPPCDLISFTEYDVVFFVFHWYIIVDVPSTESFGDSV